MLGNDTVSRHHGITIKLLNEIVDQVYFQKILKTQLSSDFTKMYILLRRKTIDLFIYLRTIIISKIIDKIILVKYYVSKYYIIAVANLDSEKYCQ